MRMWILDCNVECILKSHRGMIFGLHLILGHTIIILLRIIIETSWRLAASTNFFCSFLIVHFLFDLSFLEDFFSTLGDSTLLLLSVLPSC